MSIPTPHIEAKNKDEIAKTVLMPGDPLRAKYIAENYLDDPVLFNSTRGMLGYTGYYKGKKVSVMGSGMGLASSMIYYNELFMFYDVETIIRVGTAGSMQEDVKLKDIVVATSACSDSAINTDVFGKYHFSVTPDFNLLLKASEKSKELNLNTHFGQVLSAEEFYSNMSEEISENMRKYGIMCVEMETYGLYTVARRRGKKGLGLFTISDSLITGEADSAENRQNAYTNMMELALEIAIG
ncbi:MAG: purine-nucleoside phosphorylase [Tissierellia bacterium]|nr:purine-nucleoside phosphorylase [Tissierellia bacterium]